MKRYLVRWAGPLALVLLSACNQPPEIPPLGIQASTSPATIARGEYLVYGPAGCARCHTRRDDQARLQQGETLPLQGGRQWNLSVVTLYGANITSDESTGLGNWSDDEVARVIRYGVGRDGKYIFPTMEYADITDEDLTAIVSYLRSIAPVENEAPENEWTWLGIVARAFIKNQRPTGPIRESIERAPTIKYGEYLANVLAQCVPCHTPRSQETGKFTGPPLSGGTLFPHELDASKVIVPPNLTPDPSTGRITHWGEDGFVARMQAGTTILGTHMPWGAYARTTDQDLRAIYRYLMSVPPVVNDPGPSIQPAPGVPEGRKAT